MTDELKRLDELTQKATAVDPNDGNARWTAGMLAFIHGRHDLEVDVIPVSDVERSKQFYGRLGWRLDDDVAPAIGVRIVQFTPPGSGCSVTFGKGLTAATPGSAAGALVVSDIVAAHQDLVSRGIEAMHGSSRRSRRGVPA